MKYIKLYEKYYTQEKLDEELYQYSKIKSALQKMRELIKNGANVNNIQSNGYTPLMRASYFMLPNAVKLLIENGAIINVQNYDGFTPLMLASVNTYDFISTKRVKEIIDILINNDADLNIQNTKGQDAFDLNQHLRDYINNKFPEKYKEYITKKTADKFNL